MDQEDTNGSRSATIDAVESSGSRQADETPQTEVVRETVQAQDDNQVDGAPVKPRNKGGRPKGVKRAAAKLSQNELATIVADYARGMPQKDIARKQGISDAAVSQILAKFQPFFTELGNVEEYRRAKADIFDGLQLQTLKSMSCKDKQDKASLADLSKAFDVLYKAGRLERGLSTDNKAVQSIQVRTDRPKFVTDN